ncbi:MAG: hypothetical protein AABZ12_05630 [Planctomycetota bacterium]
MPSKATINAVVFEHVAFDPIEILDAHNPHWRDNVRVAIVPDTIAVTVDMTGLTNERDIGACVACIGSAVSIRIHIVSAAQASVANVSTSIAIPVALLPNALSGRPFPKHPIIATICGRDISRIRCTGAVIAVLGDTVSVRVRRDRKTSHVVTSTSGGFTMPGPGGKRPSKKNGRLIPGDQPGNRRNTRGTRSDSLSPSARKGLPTSTIPARNIRCRNTWLATISLPRQHPRELPSDIERCSERRGHVAIIHHAKGLRLPRLPQV